MASQNSSESDRGLPDPSKAPTDEKKLVEGLEQVLAQALVNDRELPTITAAAKQYYDNRR